MPTSKLYAINSDQAVTHSIMLTPIICLKKLVKTLWTQPPKVEMQQEHITSETVWSGYDRFGLSSNYQSVKSLKTFGDSQQNIETGTAGKKAKM